MNAQLVNNSLADQVPSLENWMISKIFQKTDLAYRGGELFCFLEHSNHLSYKTNHNFQTDQKC